jgi:hypothetical protein
LHVYSFGSLTMSNISIRVYIPAYQPTLKLLLNVHNLTRRILLFFSFESLTTEYRSQDSSVGIETGYGLEDQGVGVPSPCRVKNFLISRSRKALKSIHPPIQWVPGGYFPGVDRLGREAEVKKMWIYTSTPPYAFMA